MLFVVFCNRIYGLIYHLATGSLCIQSITWGWLQMEFQRNVRNYICIIYGKLMKPLLVYVHLF